MKNATDTPAPDAARSEETPPGPPSLDPTSASCLIPFGIGLVVVFVAWLGLRSIREHTGPWAVQAAKTAIDRSGLQDRDRSALREGVDRLERAFDAGEIDAQEVVEGVEGILENALIPKLAIEDARVRRLPASELTAEFQERADTVLAQLSSLAETELLEQSRVYMVLGPLGMVPDDGSPPVLSDEELRELVGRAESAIESIDDRRLATWSREPVTRETLLNGFRRHVDAIVDGDG